MSIDFKYSADLLLFGCLCEALRTNLRGVFVRDRCILVDIMKKV